MADAKQAWSEVGERLSALGLKLKFHTEEELSSDDDTTAASNAEKLKKSISEFFDAMGDAARDQAVRDDAKSVASAFGAAIDATIEEAKKAFKSKK
jgi:hypothetical protein